MPAVERPTKANVESSLEISANNEKSELEDLVAQKREQLIKKASMEVFEANLASGSAVSSKIDNSLVTEIREELIRKASSEVFQTNSVASRSTSNRLVHPHKLCYIYNRIIHFMIY